MNLVTPLRFTFILVLAAASCARAALTLGSPFDDHMVLQQEMRVPVWGWADPGSTVTVEFAGQKKTATADASRAWRVTLDPLTVSSDAREFVVHADGAAATPEVRRITDVLVGEVWICGGQSNMERELGLRAGQKPIVGWQQAAAAADYPTLRQFYVPQHTADSPRSTTEGAWTVCTPRSAPTFTAVGFFFARALQQAHPGVPVGLIHSSWGGTIAEAWTSQSGLAGFPEFAGAMELARRAAADPAGARRAYLEKLDAWYQANDPGTRERWWQPGHDVSTWETIVAPGLWEEAGHPDWDGIAWYQRNVDIPASWAGHELVLNLAAVDDVDTTWFNGVEVGTTSYYSTQRTYRVPAAAVKAGVNEITLRVLDVGGGGGIWDSRLKLGLAPADGSAAPVSLAGPWRIRFARELGAMPPPPENVVAGGPNVPTILYNAMIAPLIPYAIRGVTFYQGEANDGRAAQYRRLLPALIADWRGAWAEGDFPFLYVQIAPFKGMSPEIREAQLLAWKATKNTAMIVTIDHGDAAEIHPAEKQPVGERLALAARALAYGEKIEYSGPVYDSLTIEGARAILHFTHLDGGLVAKDGALVGFTVAGGNGKFRPAQAVIEGETVVVTSPEIALPAAVRYGWANVAAGNLFNKAGLPASPFRTDAPK